MKKLYRSYKHAIPLFIYMIVYLGWFAYVEQKVNIHSKYTVIHTALDDAVPFWEVFVIPYLLWFAYVSAVVLFLLFKDKEEYFRTCVFLFTGMTVFLIVSTLWPNGLDLRPGVMPRDNVFTRIIAALYRTDTPTNVWPSIHVFNSIGVHIAVCKTKRLEDYKWIRRVSFVLCSLIILSTMLIKQHSVFDVVTAFLMAAILYVIVYRTEFIASLRGLFSRRRPGVEEL